MYLECAGCKPPGTGWRTHRWHMVPAGWRCSELLSGRFLRVALPRHRGPAEAVSWPGGLPPVDGRHMPDRGRDARPGRPVAAPRERQRRMIIPTSQRLLGSPQCSVSRPDHRAAIASMNWRDEQLLNNHGVAVRWVARLRTAVAVTAAATAAVIASSTYPSE